MTAPVSWINKGKNALPDWLEPRMVARREPNGSFMIHVRRGKDKLQARVHVGSIVFEQRGELHTCPVAEVRDYIADLEREHAPIPPRQSPECAASTEWHSPAVTSLHNRVSSGKPDAKELKYLNGVDAHVTAPPAVTPSAAIHRPYSAPSKKAAKPDRTRTTKKPAPPIGSRPTIEWIHLDRLSMDISYQRSTDNHASQRLITSIAANFDWRLCLPLIVSRRPDGKLVVIDGQHRLLGGRLRKMDDLPCCVFTFDSVEEEAKMFVAMNRSRKAMNRLDDFHAALAAGDSEAHQVRQLVEEAGLTIARNTASSSWKPGEIAFTASIASTLKKHGAEIVAAALTNIAEAFPDQKVVHSGSIFLGIVKVLSSPPEGFDRDRMFRALLKYDAEGWGSFVTGLKGGDTRASAIRDALLMAYEETEVEQHGDVQ